MEQRDRWERVGAAHISRFRAPHCDEWNVAAGDRFPLIAFHALQPQERQRLAAEITGYVEGQVFRNVQACGLWGLGQVSAIHGARAVALVRPAVEAVAGLGRDGRLERGNGRRGRRLALLLARRLHIAHPHLIVRFSCGMHRHIIRWGIYNDIRGI